MQKKVFAHKTGSLITLCYGDVGIMSADRPYLLCAINNGMNCGPSAFSRISSLIYQRLTD